MPSRKAFSLALLLAGAVFAQTPEDGVISRAAGVHYPPLADAARVQGDVHLIRNAGVVTLISGPPLLAQTAINSAKAVVAMQGENSLELTYHFVFVNTTIIVTTSTTVKERECV
jgi:hypothetical protein